MTKEEHLKWALLAIDLVYNGLKSSGYKEGSITEGKDGAFLVIGSTELINLSVARASIKAACDGDNGGSR